jgi:hypothetical protein
MLNITFFQNRKKTYDRRRYFFIPIKILYIGNHLETEQSHLLGGNVVLDKNGFSPMTGPTGSTVSL